MKQIGEIYTHQLAISHAQQKRLVEIINKEKAPTSRLGVQTTGWASAKMPQGTHEEWPIAEYVGTISVLMNELTKVVKPVRYWFMSLDKGGIVDWHDHNQSDWVACFYPQSVADGEGGLIEFETGEILQPVAGLVAFFPGTLQHRVQMYVGDKPRLSIPFNRDVGE